MLQQAIDFGAECAALDGFLQELAPEMWTHPTAFKGWTPNEILLHLHHWNRAQDRALTDPEGFRQDVTRMFAAIAAGNARLEEARAADTRGDALRAVWAQSAAQIATRWRSVDPKQRLPWVGPDMSARSAMTARQMETWAHGLAIWDLVGRVRPEADRLRNIVHLGVSTFAWSHQVQGFETPAAMPYIELTAPSGEPWSYGTHSEAERIEGAAVEFAMIVTQTRNAADTGLRLTGPIATRWMTHAQCFAGPRETPPPPGSRGLGVSVLPI